jgi:hypothetical protein
LLPDKIGFVVAPSGIPSYFMTWITDKTLCRY